MTPLYFRPSKPPAIISSYYLFCFYIIFFVIIMGTTGFRWNTGNFLSYKIPEKT